MALATYADLKAAIARWLRRSDLSDVIPDLIVLAEATMNRELETVLQRAEQAITITAAPVGKPAGFKSSIAMRLTSGVCTPILEWTPAEMSAAKAVPVVLQGYPQRFCSIGSQFEFYPVPDGSYTAQIIFEGGFTPLSDANPSNWILAGHPDAYLYGALSEGSAFAKNFDNASAWKGEFDRVIDEIKFALRPAKGRTLRVDSGIRQRRSGRTFNYLTGEP